MNLGDKTFFELPKFEPQGLCLGKGVAWDDAGKKGPLQGRM